MKKYSNISTLRNLKYQLDALLFTILFNNILSVAFRLPKQ